MSENVYTTGEYQVWLKPAEHRPGLVHGKPARYEVLHANSTRAPYQQVITASAPNARERAIAMADALAAKAAAPKPAPAPETTPAPEPAPETVEQATPAPRPATLATARQVDYAMTLIARSAGYGLPTHLDLTHTQLTTLTKGQISAIIDELKEQY